MNSIGSSGYRALMIVFTVVYLGGFLLLSTLGAYLAIRLDRWLQSRK